MIPVNPTRKAEVVSFRVQASAKALCAQFASAEPFKHLCIDDFLDEAIAERLLVDFPAFRPELAKNEYGEIATKAVNTNIRSISPAYEEFYAYLASKEFTDLVSRISGIPGLILDPKMYGGGTHENLHGQGMYTHVDFNYDNSRNLHRRLNLLVYLNKEWKEEWGGSIELHSNPRRPKEDRVKAFIPIFNRCVLFETSEHSWHGFSAVNLPPEERHRSRKSISIYLYTRERPQDEIVPPHGTFYVHGPLPAWVRPGTTLTEKQVDALEGIIAERDKYIELYQKQELRNSGEILTQARYIQELRGSVRLPLAGYIRQDGPVRGFYPDGWVTSDLLVSLAPLKPVQSLVIAGWRSDGSPEPFELEITAADEPPLTVAGRNGLFEFSVQLKRIQAEPFALRIRSAPQPQETSSPDNRELSFILNQITAVHPQKRFSFVR